MISDMINAAADAMNATDGKTKEEIKAAVENWANTVDAAEFGEIDWNDMETEYNPE